MKFAQTIQWCCRVSMMLLIGVAVAVQAAEPQRTLSLQEAIRLALDKSPDLAIAEQRVAAARAALQQVEAAFWPQVRLSGAYTGSDNPVQAFMMNLNQRAFSLGGDFNHPDTTDNLNAKILAQYPLYNGGRDTALRQAARAGTQAQEQSRQAVRNDLIFEVTRAFYTIGKARQFLRTATAAVTSMESNLTLARNRFQQGNALKSDVLDAEVRLAEAKENLVRAHNALSLAEVYFRSALGIGQKENLTAAETETASAKTVTLASDEAALDLSARPELAAAQKAVEAAEQQVRVAQSGYRPRANVFASYDLDSGNATRYAGSWLAGVSVELNVFDGFLTKNKVAEARANLTAAREQLRKVQLALELEAKQAQLNLREAEQRLETTAQAVAQAEESVQLTKERYAGGLALLTQLLDAETALTAAHQRRAAAETDVLIARAALEKALGKIGKE